MTFLFSNIEDVAREAASTTVDLVRLDGESSFTLLTCTNTFSDPSQLWLAVCTRLAQSIDTSILAVEF